MENHIQEVETLIKK